MKVKLYYIKMLVLAAMHALRVEVLWLLHLLGLIRAKKQNRLDADVIVSLTSFPPRFPTLHLTLKSLLLQESKVDRLVLWVAYDDLCVVPISVRSLEKFGLEVRACEDIRSYKKLVPALLAFPDSYIATADDDVYYAPNWLTELTDGLSIVRREIPAQRCHKIVLGGDNLPLGYNEWQNEISTYESGPLIFPTGAGGTLYPPRSLNSLVTETSLFRELCPDADDVWFYWMAMKNNYVFKKVGSARLVNWLGSQKTSLYSKNSVPGTGNDLQIQNMIKRFGWPPTTT
jgi:hypothetical protein